MLDKARIGHSFGLAAPAYDAHATMQRQAAQRLADLTVVRWPQLSRIFEIGCGTGNLTAHLAQAYPQADICATDLTPQMLQACQQRLGSRVGYAVVDGESASCQGFDLVASSLTFQWFEDPVRTLRKLWRQGPRLAVATLLEGTFAEWKAAHAQLGLDDGVLTFVTEARWQDLCQHMDAPCTVETIQEFYPDAMTFVRAVKAIGAGTPRVGHRPAPLGKVLRQFPHGITVTYKVAYLLADPEPARPICPP